MVVGEEWWQMMKGKGDRGCQAEEKWGAGGILDDSLRWWWITQ